MQRDLHHLVNNNPATVIAYPINSPLGLNKNQMEENVYSSSIGDSNFADDTIEMSGNFFSQLDSMIAAVKVESSALDSMKEKLKEVDALRNQISTFTKRLLDADQANLNLKTNLVKVQEAFTELKKQKGEVESSMVPLRQELNRTKEAYSKERMARLSAQQETALLKEQIMRLEKINENLDRECKTIPPLIESNEMLKNDLANVRKRFKEEKSGLLKQLKSHEAQSREVDVIKSEVRTLSLRLLDLASNGTNNAGNTSSVVSGVPSNYSSGAAAPSHASMLAQRQSNEHQMNFNSSNSVVSNVQYEYGFEEEDEYGEYGADYEEGNVSRGDDSLYGDGTINNDTHSLDSSIPSQAHISPPRKQQNQQQLQGGQQVRQGKKKVKRIIHQQHQQQGSGRGPNLMQQLPNDSYQQQQQQQQQQYGHGGAGGMVQSFSLPRIH